MAKKKQVEEDKENNKPIREIFKRINMIVGMLDFSLGMPDKEKEQRQILKSIAQDIKDLKELLIHTGKYDGNFICLECFVNIHHLAKSIYKIPEHLKLKDKQCAYCGKKKICRIDL